MSEALNVGIINELVYEDHPLVGGGYYCNIYVNYNSSNYNMCNGSYCQSDGQCNTDCCDDDMCDYSSNCHPGLVWLWWTLGCLFFILCIISCVAGAKRRRRIAEYNAAVRRNNAAQREDVVVQVHYQQVQQPVAGQPVQQ